MTLMENISIKGAALKNDTTTLLGECKYLYQQGDTTQRAYRTIKQI